jgi:hypothetical protein
MHRPDSLPHGLGRRHRLVGEFHVDPVSEVFSPAIDGLGLSQAGDETVPRAGRRMPGT